MTLTSRLMDRATRACLLPVFGSPRTTYSWKRWCTSTTQPGSINDSYDVIVVGAGHNGLVCAAYMAAAGIKVCVLERRHLIGGAAVTEEIIKGYKFSRASYVLSLFRPQIMKDLDLKSHGLETIARDPYSYTPMLDGRSLLLGKDSKENHKQISQFSHEDAHEFQIYEQQLSRICAAVEPLLDAHPVNFNPVNSGVTAGSNRPMRSMDSWKKNYKAVGSLTRALRSLSSHPGDLAALFDLMTSPAEHVLSSRFRCAPLQATLAMDACIGSMASPLDAGTGYVLLHHVMGEIDGEKGAWAYVKGGMGSVSEAIGRAAILRGVDIFVDEPVDQITTTAKGRVTGVRLHSGHFLTSDIVVSNATPHVTYNQLLSEQSHKLPKELMSSVNNIDYRSPVAKINVAVDRLPDFSADPYEQDDQCPKWHRGSIHLNCESIGDIHRAYTDASLGRWSHRPVIEMTIPSVSDCTLAPKGHHVVQLFVQYVPYHLSDGKFWDNETRNKLCDHVFDNIERYAPGFKKSVVGRDILTPVDLEEVFGLTGGNIFHGAMSLNQLYSARPCLPLGGSSASGYVEGLFSCGSSNHPGGGVMGSPGKLAAETILSSIKMG